MISITPKVLWDGQKPGTPEKLLSGVHSGHLGDVVYSLPTVCALGIRHLYLNAHACGRLTFDTASHLAPLLMAQPYIDRVTIIAVGVCFEFVDSSCLSFDYNLDKFRLEDVMHLHLIEAHARAQGITVDPNDRFLDAPDITYSASCPDVVIAVTPRHRFLSDQKFRRLTSVFKNPIVLAIPEDWRAITGFCGSIWKCRDLLEMAAVIKKGPLFVGTPSLGSAIAEGLKVPRIIDLPLEPNAFPIGRNGYVIPSDLEEFVELVSNIRANELLEMRNIRLER